MKHIFKFLHRWFHRFLALKCPNCGKELVPSGYRGLNHEVKQLLCPHCKQVFIKM